MEPRIYRNEHLRALGAVAAVFGDIELQLFWVLGAKSELPPPKANILLAGEPFHSMLAKLRALFAYENSATPEEERFKNWADRMARAAKRRNEVTHSAWLDLTQVSPETLAEKWPNQVPPELIRLRPGKAPQHNAAVPGHPATVSELEELAEELRKLAEELKEMEGDGLFDRRDSSSLGSDSGAPS